MTDTQYFWILTIQAPSGVAGANGFITVGKSSNEGNRFETAYKMVQDGVLAKGQPFPNGLPVLFWYCQPN